MVMSQDENAGWSHNIKTDDSSFESVEEFKYLGITITNNKFNKITSQFLKYMSSKYHKIFTAKYKHWKNETHWFMFGTRGIQTLLILTENI
jgi:hypothetical protein